MDYTDDEVKRRTEAALRAAFNTPHKPMKDIPKKRPASSKAKRSSDASKIGPDLQEALEFLQSRFVASRLVSIAQGLAVMALIRQANVREGQPGVESVPDLCPVFTVPRPA